MLARVCTLHRIFSARGRRSCLLQPNTITTSDIFQHSQIKNLCGGAELSISSKGKTCT
uniref:Uncharacterized protein n=1 Tax=Arundo donax TaxID=35708 RepID=A0A0A9AFN8_ARUDO